MPTPDELLASKQQEAKTLADEYNAGQEEINEKTKSQQELLQKILKITGAIEALQEVSTPDELQNVALFLAAPALVGEGSDSFDLLLSIVEQKESVIGAEKGLYTALGAIAGTLPNSSDSLRPNRVADVIIARMCDSRADSASTMGVAAEALGIICHGLCANGFDVSSSWRADFVRRICGFLCEALSVLGASNSLCESRQFQFYAYNIY